MKLPAVALSFSENSGTDSLLRMKTNRLSHQGSDSHSAARFFGFLFLLLAIQSIPIHAAPPGTVIDYSPASSGLYIGSPSIVILPSGEYLASHDFFGPNSAEFESPTSVVFRSRDRGKSWSKTATLKSLFWAGLFVHRDAVYIMGTDRHHGRIVIRRSEDHGRTWTEPVDGASGQLTSRTNYHTAPTPVIEHAGRLWRAFEDASGGSRWGMRYLPLMLSVPVEADLLNATNWTFSETVPRDPSWLEGKFNAWLEGNAVLTPEKAIVNILRVDVESFPEKAAILAVAPDGRTQAFDPARDIIDFPGGAKKFTIRFDPQSGAYWTLATATPERFQTGEKPSRIRNTLALLRSENLRQWETRAILLQHEDVRAHAFQYPDWQFDGEDIIAAVRTAHEDGQGGAHNAHDANYLTFHRFAQFRQLR
jgi:hypothetical protein